MGMSYIQYLSKKRELSRAIRVLIDSKLVGLSRSDIRPIVHTDAERREHYALLVYAQGWGLRVRDETHRLALDVALVGKRVRVGGLRSKNGRIAHLETVPVAHILKITAELLERLPTNK